MTKHWTSVNNRLKNIIADGLDIRFISSPLVKKTARSEICIPFFYIKFEGEIIWAAPKDFPYNDFMFSQKDFTYLPWRFQNGKSYTKWDWKSPHTLSSPENIIACYLDLPKSQLPEFAEPAGLKYILWAVDKRIGKNRLKNIQFTSQAQKIIKKRIPDYNLPACSGNIMTQVYSDSEITIFGNSEWYLPTDGFIVCDNPVYSLAKHGIVIDYFGKGRIFWKTCVGKNYLKITPETEVKIINALKTQLLNDSSKTVWEDLITLHNKYSLSYSRKFPEDTPVISKITVLR